MCIISAKPENLILNTDVIYNMWHNNSDGAGFMYAENNKLFVQKGYMTFEEFLAAYEPHKDRSMVLHFRIRTHGLTDATMTHPFVVDKDLAFAHNGIISGLGDQTHSDTWYFNEDIIKKLRARYSNFLSDDVICNLISSRIGASKLVFMDNTGKITIINENLGEKSSDGIWFSNGSWNREPVVVKYPQIYNIHNRRLSKSQEQQRDYYEKLFNTENVFDYNQTITPTTKENQDDLLVGDYVVTTSDMFNLPVYKQVAKNHKNIEKNGFVLDKLPSKSIMKIVGFNQDLSIDCYDFQLKRTIRLRSGLFLDRVKYFGTTRHQWGHIPTCSRVFVAEFDTKFAKVIDPKLDRAYTIPTRSLNISLI